MKIKEIREEYNISRADLSRWLNIPYRTLENWERGANKCPDYLEDLIIEKIKRDCSNVKLPKRKDGFL